ncbi:MAG: restriction endonuclease subunit S [Pedobacter sp.]|nr:MAG: restriction endonuclease subunit S [Pedobacter sp.]
MKVYEEYKDSGAAEIEKIPQSWSVAKLKRVCSFIYGNSLHTDIREEGRVPLYGSNGITGYHSQSITLAPCIIVGRKGSFGKINYSQVPCFPIDTTYFIDKSATNNNLRWLYYALQTLNLDGFSKDTGVPGLSREDAYNRDVPLPPIEEQHAIANFLDEKTAHIVTLVTKKKQLIELLKEERIAIVNHAVTKGINPDAPMQDSGIEWLGEVPAHWEVKKLKYVANTVQTGSTPPSESKEYYEEGVINWFAPSDFKDSIILENSNRKITPLAIEKGVVKSFPPNSVYLIGIGATLGKVGICNEAASCNQQLNVITFKPIINPYFGALYLSSISKIIVSLANAATLAILNQTQTKDLIFVIPPKKEQEEIVNYIQLKQNTITSTILKIESEINLLQEYRTAIISEAVTGKIDVRSHTSADHFFNPEILAYAE